MLHLVIVRAREPYQRALPLPCRARDRVVVVGEPQAGVACGRAGVSSRGAASLGCEKKNTVEVEATNHFQVMCFLEVSITSQDTIFLEAMQTFFSFFFS